MAVDPARDVIAFGERLLALLDQGSFVATYKYAVLVGLMDLCLEKADRHGVAPDSVTTRQLAEKVIELYWPQTAEFRGRTLKQNSGRQARILSGIIAFREALPDPSVPLQRARREAPARFERLARDVEWTLILMPLPRLQVVGGHTVSLVYEIGWDVSIERSRREVREQQRTGRGSFDNQIRFLPSVGDHLVKLNGLLRPLIHRAWTAMVAQLNDLDESRLERFLFGVDRVQLAAVRPGLTDLQHGRCFYCQSRVLRDAEVDHFIPWARYPDNGIENLVVADKRCNAAKRDFLAAAPHVGNWRRRNESRLTALAELAREAEWERHPEDTLGVARSLYLRLPAVTRLWCGGTEFANADPARLREILG
ncbi:MAG TPA: HNH endonuclease domain-containing protein [Vicinamibacterales bacterium]|nr:HNH endonuclease domain-containing protein [Vicinamibacterales bacterium]